MVPSKKIYLYSLILCFWFLLCGTNQYVFSDDIHSTVLNANFHDNGTLRYCPNIHTDLLVGINPNNHSFGTIDVPPPQNVADPDPPEIVNERIAGNFTGRATIDLDALLAKYGNNFIIYYHDDHPNNSYNINITPTVTLAPFGSYCSYDPPFILTGGAPAGGYYKVNGVVTASFDPAIYGPGTFNVYYYSNITNCESPVQTITVTAPPVIIFNPMSDVCIYTAPFPLTQAIPVGGTYSGVGVSGGVLFSPAVAGVGTHTITYTYNNGSCTNSASRTIKVSDVPTLSFTGLDPVYCDSYPPSILTALWPAEASDNLAETGLPIMEIILQYLIRQHQVLGYIQLHLHYTNASGCVNTYTRQARVGTLITFSGLDNFILSG